MRCGPACRAWSAMRRRRRRRRRGSAPTSTPCSSRCATLPCPVVSSALTVTPASSARPGKPWCPNRFRPEPGTRRRPARSATCVRESGQPVPIAAGGRLHGTLAHLAVERDGDDLLAVDRGHRPLLLQRVGAELGQRARGRARPTPGTARRPAGGPVRPAPQPARARRNRRRPTLPARRRTGCRRRSACPTGRGRTVDLARRGHADVPACTPIR